MNTSVARYPIMLVALIPLLGGAAVPVEGIRAEQEKRWLDAVAIYRQAIKSEPGQLDLWFRLADIFSVTGDREQLLTTLEDAARAMPREPKVFIRLSRVYAAGNDPAKALAACLRAVELSPDNREYLLACASHANWTGDFEQAELAYRKLLDRNNRDPEALLGRARSRSWSGSLDQAARDYEFYIGVNPDDQDAWIEYARVEIWKGNYHKASRLLDECHRRFGETWGCKKEKARLLAWAGRPSGSRLINDRLLADHPDDYELNYTNTIILHRSGQHREAIDSLGLLGRLRPTAKETLDMGRVVRIPARSSMQVAIDHYSDSDTIRANSATLSGVYRFSPEYALTAGALAGYQTAQTGSGLEPVTGGEDITYRGYWIGLEHRLDHGAVLHGEVGKGSVEDGGSFDIVNVRGSLDLSDQASIRLAYEENIFDISPRTLSLGITRETLQAELHWEPDLRHVVDVQMRRDELSDGNRRDQLLVGPRRALIRNEKLNLDLGVSAEWQSYAQDLANGYYDPSDYRRFAFTAFAYRKLSDDNGVSVSASIGWHKDENMDSYRLGEDLVAEGFFGIYEDWFLRARIGYSDRHEGAGSYDGVRGSLLITRRLD